MPGFRPAIALESQPTNGYTPALFVQLSIPIHRWGAVAVKGLITMGRCGMTSGEADSLACRSLPASWRAAASNAKSSSAAIRPVRWCMSMSMRSRHTPVAISPIYYGNRTIRLVKDGCETKTVKEPMPPPWYEIPPLDFFSENVVPGTLNDSRTLDFQLQPQGVVPKEELLARARRPSTRNAGRRVIASPGYRVNPPERPAYVVPAGAPGRTSRRQATVFSTAARHRCARHSCTDHNSVRRTCTEPELHRAVLSAATFVAAAGRSLRPGSVRSLTTRCLAGHKDRAAEMGSQAARATRRIFARCKSFEHELDHLLGGICQNPQP